MDRRSFFQKTVGAVVTATIAGKVTLDGKELNANELKLKGLPEDCSSLILYRAMDFAQENSNSQVLLIYPSHHNMFFPYQKQFQDINKEFTYSASDEVYAFANGSVLHLGTTDNAMKFQSCEFNAVWAHEVDKETRERAFDRARLAPRKMEWTEA